jgi:4-hydroxy-tetrahydrodipicolinate synthase
MGQRPEMAIEHFRRIVGAADLPIIAFQYPLAGGQGYPLATILKIIEAVPAVRAIKDWCASPQLHERQIRTLQSLGPPVNVLTTHSSWLMSSLVAGANGSSNGR